MSDLPAHPQTDLRIRRTRRLLTQALIELTAELPFEAVTVRTLTERAEVGYTTFFRHYASIEDLLRAAVDDLLAELIALLPPLTGNAPQHAAALIFQHVREHPGLYRLLLSTTHSLDVRAQIVEIGARELLQTYEARQEARVPLDIAATHLIQSFLNLIDWWLRHDMLPAPERMGDIYCELILRPVENTALRPRSSRTSPVD